MKEFWIYTLMRVALFVGAFCLTFGIWVVVADEVNVTIAVIIAFVVSGVGSYFLLERQRRAFAVKVEGRAGRISEKFNEQRAKEDTD